MRIEMISGPPAIPNLRGTGIFGRLIGILPKMIPTTIPIKIVAIFGASRWRVELPTNELTRFTLSSGPTTIILSPIWKR